MRDCRVIGGIGMIEAAPVDVHQSALTRRVISCGYSNYGGFHAEAHGLSEY